MFKKSLCTCFSTTLHAGDRGAYKRVPERRETYFPFVRHPCPVGHQPLNLPWRTLDSGRTKMILPLLLVWVSQQASYVDVHAYECPPPTVHNLSGDVRRRRGGEIQFFVHAKAGTIGVDCRVCDGNQNESRKWKSTPLLEWTSGQTSRRFSLLWFVGRTQNIPWGWTTGCFHVVQVRWSFRTTWQNNPVKYSVDPKDNRIIVSRIALTPSVVEISFFLLFLARVVKTRFIPNFFKYTQRAPYTIYVWFFQCAATNPTTRTGLILTTKPCNKVDFDIICSGINVKRKADARAYSVYMRPRMSAFNLHRLSLDLIWNWWSNSPPVCYISWCTLWCYTDSAPTIARRQERIFKTRHHRRPRRCVSCYSTNQWARESARTWWVV